MAMEWRNIGAWLDDLLAPRLHLPLAVGIGLGLGVYHLTGQTPASAAVAAGLGLLGLVVGILLHAARNTRDDADGKSE